MKNLHTYTDHHFDRRSHEEWYVTAERWIRILFILTALGMAILSFGIKKDVDYGVEVTQDKHQTIVKKVEEPTVPPIPPTEKKPQYAIVPHIEKKLNRNELIVRLW